MTNMISDHSAFRAKLAAAGGRYQTRDEPSLADLKAMQDDLLLAFEQFKAKNDRRIDLLAKQMARPGGPGERHSSDAIPTDAEVEHKAAFAAWVRNPNSTSAQMALEAAQQKAVTIGSESGGGYAVPTILHRELTQRLRDLVPLRQLCRVIQVESASFKMPVDLRGATAGWVGEGDTRSETGTPTLGEVAPTFGTVYAYPKASEESLADIGFDVGEWLIRTSSEELAIAENAAFISGDGSKKPTGFLNGSPVATGDNDSPARAFGTLQYIPTGFASGFGGSQVDSPPGNPGDVLFTTVYSLRAGYRANARWLMNSATAGTIRKFKDADGNYLWRDGLAAGQPALLCGYPVTIDEAMPDIGSNAFPVAFGDFMRGYVICDSFTTKITVDDNITTPGQVKFYVRKRVGGKVLDDHAIRVIKCAVS